MIWCRCDNVNWNYHYRQVRRIDFAWAIHLIIIMNCNWCCAPLCLLVTSQHINQSIFSIDRIQMIHSGDGATIFQRKFSCIMLSAIVKSHHNCCHAPNSLTLAFNGPLRIIPGDSVGGNKQHWNNGIRLPDGSRCSDCSILLLLFYYQWRTLCTR